LEEELSSSASQSYLIAAAEQILTSYSQTPLAPAAAPTNGGATTSAKVPDTTTFTNRSKRPSKIELAATLRKIPHLLAEGYTNKEIMETL
jgi:DNA-binding NarL/FixJ family response regulator